VNRTVALLAAIAAGAPASALADTLGGFSAVDKSYLVNADRVCTPLRAEAGAATGTLHCEKAATDAIAKLDFKPAVLQTGTRATFQAAASGRSLTVSRRDTGETVVTWQADDPIVRVVEVDASQLEDRVAVIYASRRAGHELTDIVAFDLLRDVRPADPTQPVAPVAPVAPQHVDAPDVVKAIADARKAAPAKALAAWQAVLAVDAQHSEAQFRVAELQAGGKSPADAIATLEQLAKSPRPDAIEWLVEARFDKAFAKQVSDLRFRTAVGLDRKAGTPYERFMGLGGKWEQAGTPCDSATVSLVALQDRSFKLRVKTTCSGTTVDLPFHGTWRIEGNDTVVLAFPPNKGKQATVKDESACSLTARGDEDALHCSLGKDIDFTVLPVRR
jgi:hypothetical protein